MPDRGAHATGVVVEAYAVQLDVLAVQQENFAVADAILTCGAQSADFFLAPPA